MASSSPQTSPRDAKELGLTEAFSETFAVARPAGDGRAMAKVPIVGRCEWESGRSYLAPRAAGRIDRAR